MDIGIRIMNQVEVTTTLTLVGFLSNKLESIMSTLEIALASGLILIFTYLFGREYVLSPLTRRLAVLLIFEKVRPWLNVMMKKENLIQINGIIVASGILCVIALIPNELKKIKEIERLVQCFIYSYSNIFDFLITEENNHVLILCINAVVLGLISFVSQKSKIYSEFSNISSIVVTSLSLSIIQANIGQQSETAIIHLLLIFTFMMYSRLEMLRSVQDYIVFNIAMFVGRFIVNDKMVYCVVLFVLLRILLLWLSLNSQFIQILILTIVNTTVNVVLSYIQNLAVHDTLITLKTSALVLQFIVHFVSEKFLVQQS